MDGSEGGADVTPIKPLRRSNTTSLQIEYLWDQAVKRLSEDDRQQVDFSRDDKREALSEILAVVETEKTSMKGRQWKLGKRSDGEPIVLRDVLGKIASWIDKFKEVGDNAANFDPVHAALPWAAVRFVLQAVVNETHTYEGMLEGLEKVSSLITRYAMVEDMYLRRSSSSLEGQLSNALIRLYTSILVFLAKSRKYFSRKTGGRIVRSVFQDQEMTVGKYMQKVSVEEAAIDSLAHLINADYMRKINDSMEGKLAALLDNVGRISGQIEGLQLTQKTSATDLIRDSIIQWIGGVKTYWQDYERALAACVAGTCDWIFQRPEFEDWIGPDESDAAKILWIHGHPGFGKTVLTARMTERLGQARSVAYFFCFFSDQLKRQPQQILRSWVAQLVALSDAAFEMAKEVYATKKHPEATESELWQLFGLVNVKIRNMVFVVDGFDECSTEEQDLRNRAYLPARKRFLKSLEEAIGRTGARVLLVSRENSDIRTHVTRSFRNGDFASISWLELEITPADSEYGIHVYAEKIVEERLHTKSTELKKDIANRLTQKSEGMFLYIYRIQARLKSSMSASKLRSMIDDTPRGRDFDEAYQRDLQAIASLEDDDERERAVAILRWVYFAARPLTVRELAEALIVSADEDNTMDRCFPIEDLPDEWDQTFVEEQITGLCGSLIDLRGKEAGKSVMDQEVHFVHFTIKEYLSRPDRLDFPVSLRNDFLDTFQAHEKIVKACLRYMCYKDFIQTDHSTKPMFDDKLVKYPFLRFAGVSWTFHMSQCRPFSAEIIRLCNAWLDPANLRWMSYSEVVGSNANGTFENFMGQFRDSYPNPLFYASLWGLVHTMRYLIERGAGVNVIGGLYGSPLQAASAHGHLLAVEILFQHGADVNLAGGKWGCALQAAADNAQEQIVDTLLAHKANVNLTGGAWNSALIAASNRFQTGACRIIRRLLEVGARIDAVTDQGETALHRAAAEGALDVIDLLLDKGASINAISNSGQTPLQKASYIGRNESIKCLLRRGANVEISSYDKRTPLHFAAEQGHETIVQLLLDRGADISAYSKDKWTPLHCAAENGHNEVVRLLLKCDADMEAAAYNGKRALHLAVEMGQVKIVDILLAGGANMNAGANDGRTPLMFALRNDRGLSMIESLLDHGAKIEATSDNGQTALHWSIHCLEVKFADLLLKRSANVNASDLDGNTPLHYAIFKPEMLELLLDHGAAVDATNLDGNTPLLLCSRSSRAGPSVRLLLDSGAGLNNQGAMGETPLCSAIKNRQIRMIEILLAEGADPELADAYGRDCYDWVSSTSTGWLSAHSQDRLVRHSPAREPAQMATVQDQSIALTIRKSQTVTAVIHSKQEQYRRSLWYSRLGHLLLLRGKLEEARTVFERFMANTVEEAEAMNFYVSCDSCEAKYVLGDRFNEMVKMDAFEVCKGHEFLKLPRPEWTELEAGKVNERGETEEQWLERLGKEYEVESPG